MQLNKFKIIILFLCLTSCAKIPISTQLVTQTKQEITNLQEKIKISSCKKNEKEIIYKKLDKIQNNMNLITSSCEMEKSLLKQKVTKLKLLLLFIIGILLIMKGI